MRLLRLLIYPPMAIARLGSSPWPCEAYRYGSNDDRPDGTGKTTVLPAETLAVAADGTLTASIPDVVVFRDADGPRPVCPFFELHAEWEDGGTVARGPATPALLAGFGLAAADLRWRVEVANLKPFHMTRDARDRIGASLELAGDDVAVHPLAGCGPDLAGAPTLVPAERVVPLGSVRLTRADDAFPGLRLRFTPATGAFYGPPNLAARWDSDVPPENRFLDPAATWCNWVPAGFDDRTAPSGQYGQDRAGVSLGLVDDTCDGLVTCAAPDPAVVPAQARIVVGPPDYAPDRRPIVSLADGLADRVDRGRPASSHGPADPGKLEAEVGDLLERVFETLGLMNLDVVNDWANTSMNPAIAAAIGLEHGTEPFYAFPPLPPDAAEPFPLTAWGRRHHRRFLAKEILADFVRKRPDAFIAWLRPPATLDPLFTRQMPALMRGSTGGPLHLTRRQYDMVLAWVRHVQAGEHPGP